MYVAGKTAQDLEQLINVKSSDFVIILGFIYCNTKRPSSLLVPERLLKGLDSLPALAICTQTFYWQTCKPHTTNKSEWPLSEISLSISYLSLSGKAGAMETDDESAFFLEETRF